MLPDLGFNVRVTKETDQQIVLAHRWFPYFGMFFVGTVMLAEGSNPFHWAPTGSQIALSALGLLLAWAGIFGAFWREEVRIDLSSRTCTWEKGWALLPLKTTRIEQLALDSLEGVELAAGWKLSVRGIRPAWHVSLSTGGQAKVTIATLRTKQEAWELARRFTKKLQLSVMAREDDLELKIPWHSLG